MARPEVRRRLIINADDYGKSSSINRAVILAHREGVLSTASLMVGEASFEEAVALARENPGLGVGLHLALSHGRAVLPPEIIPGLVNSAGEFSDKPEWTGFRYFANKSLRYQLRKEIRAQLEKFRSTGLPLDHVNGHLHFHMHPVVFDILMELVPEFEIKRMRLTRESLQIDNRISQGNHFYRYSHAFIYDRLSKRSHPGLKASAIRHTQHVFGLLQNARVDEAYILRLIPLLPEGDSELYSHPSMDDFKHELDGLLSAKVRAELASRGIQLIRYQDI